ncbi:sulfatase family protein [Halopenitus persicus]|uniref:sulfatase family protein n=1 Tax=Halopenitus persicus TaxID=1048396 RepID=UPI000BBAFA27|nr:sulfatase-like hydrolase/transferase [Halopenitus persicus]
MGRDQPNILFLMSDQHSFRHLSHQTESEGGTPEPVRTPTLDDLAGSAARFGNAYCPAPICGPSRQAILTGREEARSGGWSNSAVLPDLPTLPGTLSDAGYNTALIGKMHLGGDRQFVGFDHRPYGDLTGFMGHQGEPPNPHKGNPTDWKSLITDVGVTNTPESLLQEHNAAQETVAFIREQQHRNPDQPWFLCTSLSRPHWPRTVPRRHFERYWPDDVPEPKVVEDSATYDHPATRALAEFTKSREVSEEERQRARAAYFACVDYVDEILGDLFSRLEREGLLDDTIVVYTSDHGELAGEHGLWEKMTWHEASAKVPLLIQLPDHRSGDREATYVDTPVSLVDLYPTLCGLAGVDTPDDLDGRDLASSLRTGTEPTSRPVFVDGFFLERLPGETDDYQYRCVRRGKYKYVRFKDAPELLFDLEADPLERHDLAADAAARDAEDDDALADLRALTNETIDFEEIDEIRERDRELTEDHTFGPSKGDPNQYHFPDGRVIDADSAIYNPHVVCEHPEVVYDDYEGPGFEREP